MAIQSILFDKHYWNVFSSHQWLIHHRMYPVKSPDITTHFIRYRLRDPRSFNRLRTIKLHNGVDLVIGF